MTKSRSLSFYIYLIIAVAAFSAVFHGLAFSKILPLNVVYSDIFGFFEKAASSAQIEYPALTALLIRLSALIGGGQAGYYILNSLLLIFCAALITYFLYKLIQDKNKSRLLTYWIFAPTMIVFAIYNWDIFTLLFVVAAFYFMQKDKDYLAAGFLALGFASKLYPILYLLPLLLKHKNAKEWLKIIGMFIGAAVLVNLYFMISDFNSWIYFYKLNNLRNSNPDSIWTIVRYFFRTLTVSSINTISLLLFGSSYAWLMWKFRGAAALNLCFMATLLFLIFNKIFSPQYVLWLLPFFILMPTDGFWGRRASAVWFYILEFSNLAVLFIILPWFLMGQNINYFYAVIPFVLIRHLSLIFILAKTAKMTALSHLAIK